MIECIFSLDYEIYGDGRGSLKDLVFEPAKRLKEIFINKNSRFVLFVEVAELEMIEKVGSDAAFSLVKNQIIDFYRDGFEIGLHIHPWWYNAKYEKGKWLIDYSEYNLCMLPRERIKQIIIRAILYLKKILIDPKMVPLAYRAGHLLFQPSMQVAEILAQNGIKIDSSLYKGGLWLEQNLDYRPSLKNAYYYWKFSEDINFPNKNGVLLEIPIYAQVVPIWKMFTKKRIALQIDFYSPRKIKKLLFTLRRFLNVRRAMKLDFCQMTLNELVDLIEKVILEDKRRSDIFRPVVAIGHTKELKNFVTIERFLDYLRKNNIKISTFKDIYPKCQQME